MTNQYDHISMVILAGGKSIRMGSDKADLILKKESFLEHQLNKGKKLGITDILVSGYHGKLSDIRIIQDRMQNRGPLAGMEASLREAQNEQVLVMGIDIPMVPLQDLEQLIEKARQSEKDAVILKHGEREEPLLGVYRKRIADEMLWEIIQRKGSVFAMLNRIGYDVYLTDTPDVCFRNINDPQEYQKLLDELACPEQRDY